MDSCSKINWQDESTHLLLNPRLSPADRQELQDLSQRYALPAHIWIASSGSSKRPGESLKLIALSKKAFLASAAAVNQHLASNNKDVWLQTLPRFHVGGLSIESRSFLSGAKVISLSNWNAEEFIQMTDDQGVTLSALVPTQVFDLVKTKRRAPECLRAIIIGGAALPDDLYQQAIALRWPLLPSYGMTECCSQIATAALNKWHQGNRDLQILPHVEARVAPTGQLQIRSPSLMTGFAQVIDGNPIWSDPKMDGWYESQDRVELKGDVLVPLGRGSDFVKILGEGVDLQKLRHLLDQVAQKLSPENWQNFHLVAVPDSRSGHRLVLQILKGTNPLEIKDVFNNQVAPFERIQDLQIVEDLPWKKKSPVAW